MKEVYHYIQRQHLDLQEKCPADATLLTFLVNTLSHDSDVKTDLSLNTISSVKLLYILDALSILEEGNIMETLNPRDRQFIKNFFKQQLKPNGSYINDIKVAKILSLCVGGIDECLLGSLLTYFRSYLINKDFLFETNPTVIICDIIELLLAIRKSTSPDRFEISSLISSFLEALISYMKDVDFSQKKHSFFLNELSLATEALYWKEGDIRKSILLLKEGFHDNCPKFIALGELISQHILLISAISKIDDQNFGLYMGILGIIYGFNQLYEVTQDSVFKQEGCRWREVLENSLKRFVQENQETDIKKLIDITLSYKYLTSNQWKKSKTLSQI